jgi:hypothetical protein
MKMESFRNTYAQFKQHNPDIKASLENGGKLTAKTKLRVECNYAYELCELGVVYIKPFMNGMLPDKHRLTKYLLITSLMGMAVSGLFLILVDSRVVDPTVYILPALGIYILSAFMLFTTMCLVYREDYFISTLLGSLWLTVYRFKNDSSWIFLDKFYRNKFDQNIARILRYLSFGMIRLDKRWSIEYRDILSIVSMLQANPQSFFEIAELAQNKEELKQMLGVR